MMRVTFVISSLGAGGAEKTMSIMANFWAAKGWQVTLLCLDSVTDPFYKLEPGARHIALDVFRDSSTPFAAVFNNLRRVLALRRAITRSKPDVVISFMETLNVLTLLATRFLEIPVIVSEHMLPWLPLHEYAARGLFRSFAWERSRSTTYPFSSMLVVLTADSRDHYGSALHARTKVIPNSVQYVEEPPKTLPQGASRPLTIAMGRLVPREVFDHLLAAFSRLCKGSPEWWLWCERSR